MQVTMNQKLLSAMVKKVDALGPILAEAQEGDPELEQSLPFKTINALQQFDEGLDEETKKKMVRFSMIYRFMHKADII